MTRGEVAALLARFWRNSAATVAGGGSVGDDSNAGLGGGGGPGGGGPPGGGPPTPQKPAAPGAPALTFQDESLGVSWTAPADNGATITDYDVRYRIEDTDLNTAGKQRGTWESHPHTGVGTSAEIPSLANGTLYQVQVRATNSAGAGPWSLPAGEAPAGAPPAPGVPTVEAGHESVAVSWTAPDGNGAAITDYDVRYRACTDTNKACSDADDTWGDWTDRSGETTSDTATAATITGLDNGTAHQVQVRVANRAGDSEWSASGAATPSAQVPDRVASPDTEDVRAVRSGLVEPTGGQWVRDHHLRGGSTASRTATKRGPPPGRSTSRPPPPRP